MSKVLQGWQAVSRSALRSCLLAVCDGERKCRVRVCSSVICWFLILYEFLKLSASLLGPY